MHVISIVISQIKLSPPELTQALIKMDISVWDLDLTARVLDDAKLTPNEAHTLASYKGRVDPPLRSDVHFD